MARVVDCQEPWSPSKGPDDEPELLARCIFRNKTTLLFRNLRDEAAFTSQLWRQRSTHRTVLFAVMMVYGAVCYLVFDMVLFLVGCFAAVLLFLARYSRKCDRLEPFLSGSIMCGISIAALTRWWGVYQFSRSSDPEVNSCTQMLRAITQMESASAK